MNYYPKKSPTSHSFNPSQATTILNIKSQKAKIYIDILYIFKAMFMLDQ